MFNKDALRHWSTYLIFVVTAVLTLLAQLPEIWTHIVTAFGGVLPGLSERATLKITSWVSIGALAARLISQKWVCAKLKAAGKVGIGGVGMACAWLHHLLEGEDGAVKGRTAAKAGGIGLVLALSVSGTTFLIDREGYRLEAYRDPIGIWTICAGHTGQVVIEGVHYGPVRAGMKLTFDQCKILLQQDSEEARRILNGCVKRQLSQNQSDALISFIVNVGPSGCKSVVVQRINAGDFTGAAAAFVNWSYVTVNGRKVPMLRPRRELEAKLFLKPDNDNLPWETSTGALKQMAKAGTARGGL